jgi:flotillin
MVNQILIGVAIVVILVILVLSFCYVKASPAVAFVISGLGKNPRYLVGKGGFRVPFFERLDKLCLSQISIDVRTDSAIPTSDFILCECDSVAVIAVDPEKIQLAAKNFLNMSTDQIAQQVKETLQGNMREIIGKVDLKSLNNDRESFSSKVAGSAGADLNLMGIKVVSFNLQNVSDRQGLIEALGADNTFKIRQNAAITKAEAEKNIARSQAENAQKANEARISSETAIAEQNNLLALRKAELKAQADTAQADADAAYEIRKQEKQSIINTKTVEAQIEKTKQEKILSKEQIEIKQNELSAEVEKQADADKYRVEKTAAAELEQRKRKAEAEKYEAEQKALAENAKNEAERYKMEQEAIGIKARGEAEAAAKAAILKAEAEGIQAKGLAEAETIQAKLEAEAAGMEKKALAYQKYNEAAVTQMLIDKLPDVVKSISDSVSAIDDIKIYSTGGTGGVDSVAGIVPVVIKQAMDTMTSATGVDMKGLIEANSIKAKTDRNINLEGKTPVVDVNLE